MKLKNLGITVLSTVLAMGLLAGCSKNNDMEENWDNDYSTEDILDNIDVEEEEEETALYANFKSDYFDVSQEDKIDLYDYRWYTCEPTTIDIDRYNNSGSDINFMFTLKNGKMVGVSILSTNLYEDEMIKSFDFNSDEWFTEFRYNHVMRIEEYMIDKDELDLFYAFKCNEFPNKYSKTQVSGNYVIDNSGMIDKGTMTYGYADEYEYKLSQKPKKTGKFDYVRIAFYLKNPYNKEDKYPCEIMVTSHDVSLADMEAIAREFISNIKYQE